MPRLQSSTLLYCTLAYAGAHRCLDGERRFASWIPDFSLPKLWAVDPIHDRTYLGPSSVSEGDDGGLVLRIQAQSWRDTTDSPSPGWCPNHVTGLFPRAMSQDPTTAIKMFDDLRRWLHLLAPDADEFVERYVRTIVTGIMSQIDWRSPGDLTVYDIEDQALAAAKTWIFNKKDQNELEGPPPAVLDPLFHAIACRCFFVGRLVSYRQYNSNQERTSRFIGFGPSDLRVGDEFIASSACGKALFFRSVAGGHELLGGGYARLPVTGAEPPPRHEVTFHIV